MENRLDNGFRGRSPLMCIFYLIYTYIYDYNSGTEKLMNERRDE